MNARPERSMPRANSLRKSGQHRTRSRMDGGIHIVEQMQRAGVFRMAMPRAWGGPELNLLSQLRVIEALSIADASAGWCAMIGADGGYLTAYIDQNVAREMSTDIDSVTAVTFAPPGKAVKKGDGFIVNGRWPFASGCQHATWFIG